MERYPIKEIKIFASELCRKAYQRGTFKSFSQFQIAGYLLNNLDKDICQKDIELELNLRKSTVSNILDTMEKECIIERVIYSKDARGKVIKLTEEFISNNIKPLKEIDIINKKIIKGISKEDLDIFFKVLDTMKRNLKEEID